MAVKHTIPLRLRAARQLALAGKKWYHMRMNVEKLAYIKEQLKCEERLSQAASILSFDQMTICPEKGREALGDSLVTLSSYAFPLTHNEEFFRAVEEVWAERDGLDEWDRALIERLDRELRHERKVSPEFNERITSTLNRAWLDWSKAREEDSLALFLPSLKEVIGLQKERMSLWDCDEREAALSNYGRMLECFERGIGIEKLDRLFTESRERIRSLLDRILSSNKEIRTDFLHRSVRDDQQQTIAKYLLELLGFDADRGYMAESEHPFTDNMSRHDTRITTHYYSDNFLSSIYSVIHECGHALFEQLQPQENFEYFITDNKTMGMHESVSRFYENVIGRSRAFIRLIYPKICEVFPQVMRDVTEDELYEAVNFVEPSLIRTDADELTYTLHIIIRYEIEKELIDGSLDPKDAEELWEKKYAEYLGVRPERDREGLLQDVHWASDFGYFPAYALGNFYNAMYKKTMAESLDIDEAVEAGDFASINAWMRDHVFAKGDRLSPAEWIRDITGRELTASDFLDYLEEKYTTVYELDKPELSDRLANEYVRRADRIRRLSSPLLDELSSADAYSALLTDNFLRIGELADENRSMLKMLVDPALESGEQLSETVITRLKDFNVLLLDAVNGDELDIPVASLVNDRLKADAADKGDESYYIHQLDKEIEDCYMMINMTARIDSVCDISRRYREKGLIALDQLLKWVDKERFLSLDRECRRIVMVNTRYGPCLHEYQDDSPDCAKASAWRLDMLEKSLGYADDPFYREALPDYDWRYHIFRCYNYISTTEAGGFVNENCRRIASHMDDYQKLWESDPEYFGSLISEKELRMTILSAYYRAGQLKQSELKECILEIYYSRDVKQFDDIGYIDNVQSIVEYVAQSKYGIPDEEMRYTINAMYRSAVSFAFRMPKLSKLTSWLAGYSDLIRKFPDIPGGMSFEELGLNLLAAFHPPSYIHSRMVAKLAACLAGHLVDLHPELFVRVCGCDSKYRAYLFREKICDHAYHAGLCHDFGKLMIIDTVFVYGRSLLDTEYEILRSHAPMGAKLLSEHESTKEYAEVALLHHRWYDDTDGYPEDSEEGRNNTIVDIISCADCMDAATDRVGRSYNKGKTLDQYIREVDEGSGTQYAPYMDELLHVPAVRKDLEYLLSTGRQSVYRDTYRLLCRVQDETTI